VNNHLRPPLKLAEGRMMKKSPVGFDHRLPRGRVEVGVGVRAAVAVEAEVLDAVGREVAQGVIQQVLGEASDAGQIPGQDPNPARAHL